MTHDHIKIVTFFIFCSAGNTWFSCGNETTGL